MKRRTIMIGTRVEEKVMDIQSKLLNRSKSSISTSIVINGLLQYALKQSPTLDNIIQSIDEVRRSES